MIDGVTHEVQKCFADDRQYPPIKSNVTARDIKTNGLSQGG
jgi:hypothetical protein